MGFNSAFKGLNFHTSFPQSRSGSGRQNELTVSCKSTCTFHLMIRSWWWRQRVSRNCLHNSQILLGVKPPKTESAFRVDIILE